MVFIVVCVFDRYRRLGRRFTIMGFVVTSTIVVFMSDALRSISFWSMVMINVFMIVGFRSLFLWLMLYDRLVFDRRLWSMFLWSLVFDRWCMSDALCVILVDIVVRTATYEYGLRFFDLVFTFSWYDLRYGFLVVVVYEVSFCWLVRGRLFDLVKGDGFVLVTF